ncbi:MAG: methyl-accepting chemotaxis protein [Thermodesulfobacteriota bacterium]
MTISLRKFLPPRLLRLQAKNSPLPKLAEQLKNLAEGSEEDFLSLGDNLLRIQQESTDLYKRTAGSIELFHAAEGGGVLGRLEDDAEFCRLECESAMQETSSLAGTIAAVMRIMDAIDKQGQELRQFGMHLRVIGVNTGIECARYPEIQAVFQMVSEETISVSKQIITITESLAEQVELVRDARQQTMTSTQQNLADLAEEIRRAEQASATALQQVALLIERSLHTVKQASATAARITDDIHQVVMGIQFHDNLRQRIEHINHALADIEALLTGTFAGAAADKKEKICRAYLAARLQRTQLENLCTDLDMLFDSQSVALGNVVQGVQSLIRSLAEMSGGQSGSGADDASWQALVDSMAMLEQSRDRSRVIAGQVQQTAGEAGKAAQQIRQAIEATFSLANQTRLVALNSTIKAEKLGSKGKALQVLAQGMASVSREVIRLIPGFQAHLQEIVGLITQKNPVLQTQQPGRSRFDNQSMQRIFKQFATEAALIRECGGELARSLARELGKLCFIKEIIRELRARADDLSAFVESLGPVDATLLRKIQPSWGEPLKARYTMGREREIHHQLTALSSADEDAPHPACHPDAAVVLFADGFAGLQAVDEPALAEELQEPAWPALPGKMHDQCKEEFGDNVELF